MSKKFNSDVNAHVDREEMKFTQDAECAGLKGKILTKDNALHNIYIFAKGIPI